MRKFVLKSAVAFLAPLMSCAIIPPGERGLISSLGDLSQESYPPGPVFFNPLFQDVVAVPVRTSNVEERLNLPSREGLTIEAEISILYRIRGDAVRQVMDSIGPDYERSVILTTFRSAAANISSQHNAKDMHSGERAIIEGEITEQMNHALRPRGFEIETVLLKSIVLPATLARAIELKLAAEQDAQRMQFILQREQQEAERKVTEAKGIRDAQRIVNEGLTPLLIQYQSLETFRALASSPNAKVIVTDGKTPLLVGGGDEEDKQAAHP
jgi:prohibitin 1